MDRLTSNQLRFVEGIEEGKSLIDAYISAGYKESPASYSGASRLLRNVKILAELDDRLFTRKRTAQQRFGRMQDGSTNVYINILKREPGENIQLLALQQKVASDVFDRTGHKPPEEVKHTGSMELTLIDVLRQGRAKKEGDNDSS